MEPKVIVEPKLSIPPGGCNLNIDFTDNQFSLTSRALGLLPYNFFSRKSRFSKAYQKLWAYGCANSSWGWRRQSPTLASLSTLKPKIKENTTKHLLRMKRWVWLLLSTHKQLIRSVQFRFSRRGWTYIFGWTWYHFLTPCKPQTWHHLHSNVIEAKTPACNEVRVVICI